MSPKYIVMLAFQVFWSIASYCQHKPNIIIIYADDLGYGDLATYGGDIPSPNIQRIADAGITFTDFYASAPVCTPSRFGLLTGCYPHRSKHGLDEVLMPGDSGHLDAIEQIIPQYLLKEGYRTALFGKWHLGNAKETYLPCNYGFDRFVGHTHGCIDYFSHAYGTLAKDWYKDCHPVDEEGYATDLITDHALEYIAIPDTSPYFVFLSYNSPHYGKSDSINLTEESLALNKGKGGVNTLQVPESYLMRFRHVPDRYRRYYSAMVSNLDDNIGRILDFLKETGQLENTIVWFMSDNGGYSHSYFGHADNGKLSGEKGQLNEGGIRVPSLLFWKSVIKPAQTITQPAVNIDVLPTLLDLIGVSQRNTQLDGVVLTPTLINGEQIQRTIIWRYRNHTALRSGRWKWLTEKLYDLEKDVSERYDVSSRYPGIFTKLSKEAEAFLTKDEL